MLPALIVIAEPLISLANCSCRVPAAVVVIRPLTKAVFPSVPVEPEAAEHVKVPFAVFPAPLATELPPLNELIAKRLWEGPVAPKPMPVVVAAAV